MTVFIPDSCWNIWRPQPTIRALRVGLWRRIRKITRPSTEQASKHFIFYITHTFISFIVLLFFEISHLHQPSPPLLRCRFWWFRTPRQRSGLLWSGWELDGPLGSGPFGGASGGSPAGRGSRRTAPLMGQRTNPACTYSTERSRRSEGEKEKMISDSQVGVWRLLKGIDLKLHHNCTNHELGQQRHKRGCSELIR